MNILILSRFTPEVLKWSSHFYYYVLIYILVALMSWTRVYTCFIYSRQFNNPLVYKSHSNILREEYLYSYPSTELNLSRIKFSFLQHSVVCFSNLPCLYITSFHSTLEYPYLIFSNIFLCFLCIPFQL